MLYLLVAILSGTFAGLAGWLFRGWSAAYCVECDDALPLFHHWTRTHQSCRIAAQAHSAFAREVMAAVTDSGPGPARLP